MSFSVPYSASIVAILPVNTAPTVVSKRRVFESGIANSSALGESMAPPSIPLSVSYWTGAEPSATALDDVIFISGSAHFAMSNGAVKAISEATFINVIVKNGVESFDPASDTLAMFFLTGMVLSDTPGEREFALETGCWSSEVCVMCMDTFNQHN